MDPVTLIFVIATGSVALTIVLPLIFWFTQDGTLGYRAANQRSAINPTYQIKPIPTAIRPLQPLPHLTGASPQPLGGPAYQVKALPRVVAATVPNRRVLVAS